jgi:anti-sigma-K factor RskA
MNCDELRESYERYALGIAEPPEASAIREHLARDCQTCLAGIRSALELLALLGATAPPLEPPARLRSRVLATVESRPQRAPWSWVGAAVVAVAILAAIFFNAKAHRAAAELARLRAQADLQARELTRLQAALDILNQPDARQVVFGAGASPPPRGRIFLDPKRGVLLLASNLPPAPAGKAYEMWVIPQGAKPVPAGLFQSSADGTALHVLAGPVDVARTGAVAVTLEAAGGAPQPTSQPLIVAGL